MDLNRRQVMGTLAAVAVATPISHAAGYAYAPIEPAAEQPIPTKKRVLKVVRIDDEDLAALAHHEAAVQDAQQRLQDYHESLRRKYEATEDWVDLLLDNRGGQII